MSGISELWAGIAGVVLLVTMVALGVRVYIAAALTGFLGLLALKGWDVAAAVAGTIPHSKTVTYPLSVLPLFILIGFLAFHAGLTTRLFEAARRWVGWVPGGLAVSTVFASAGFAAVSGASTATAAVFSRVAIPDMLRNRYSKRLTAGVIAAGGTLASLIPPSAILVIYAIIVEESVGKLLLAGLLPGVVSVLIYVALIVGMCAVRPDLGRSIGGFTWRQRFASLPGALPIFLVVGIIFGALYTGAATPTEAGALGCRRRVRPLCPAGLSGALGQADGQPSAGSLDGDRQAHGDDLHVDLGRIPVRAIPWPSPACRGLSRTGWSHSTCPRF